MLETLLINQLNAHPKKGGNIIVLAKLGES